MQKTVFVLFFTMFIFICSSNAFCASLMEPFTFTENFESGSVGPWSSYPPAQDTAYDPTIWVKQLPGNSSKALFREITPNYEIDYNFGVMKKIGMYTGSSSTLSFKWYIKSNRETQGVLLRFAFSDGSDVYRKVDSSSRLTWENASVSFNDIVKAGEFKYLEAVAFMALCPKSDPENLLRFGIDDVKINGNRESRWTFNKPSMHVLSEWPDFIAGEHFTEGGLFALSGKPPVEINSAALRIKNVFNGADGGIYPVKKSKDGSGVWSVSVLLDAKSKITPGIWRGEILSYTKNDETVSTTFVFVVRPKDAVKGHPRLFMNSADKAGIQAKISSGRGKEIFDEICKTAKSKREKLNRDDFNYNLDAYDEKFWLPTYPGYIQAINTPAGYIRDNAVEYAVSGNAEAGEASKLALLKMEKWPSYVHPHILNQGQFTYWPVGLDLIDFALGYDMVYDCFSDSERKAVAKALYEKGVTQVYKEYVEGNRVSSNTSNWISHVTGGGILCAVAIMGEYSDKELEPYLTGMILKLGNLVDDTFDKDGDYGEGYSYHNFTMQTLTEIMPVLEKNFGIELQDKIKKSHEYIIYQMRNETKTATDNGDTLFAKRTNSAASGGNAGKVFDFGDTSNPLAVMSNFAYLVGKYHDPYLKGLYDLSPGKTDRDLFFMDDTIQGKSPASLNPVKLFSDVGTAVFRSGFNKDDFMFVFRCGPFYNHQHFDQGAFYLSDKGGDFLTEVGRADYYNDPWYQRLVIQPGGHNCVLVNKNPESQRAGDFLRNVNAWKNYARITDFVDFNGGSFVSGRLDPIYKGTLDYFSRSALYIKPRTVILIDQVAGNSLTESIQLRFHAPRKENIDIQGADSYIRRPEGNLLIHTSYPLDYTAESVKRAPTIYEFNAENAVTMKPRGFLELSEDLNNNKNTTFVNVMSTDPEIAKTVTETRGDGFVLVKAGDVEYYVKTVIGKDFSDNAISTDALVFRMANGGFEAMCATKVRIKGDNIFSSDKPVSIVVSGDAVKKIVFSARETSRVLFTLKAKPSAVLLDGKKTKDWNYSSGKGFSMTLNQGSGTIEIK